MLENLKRKLVKQFFIDTIYIGEQSLIFKCSYKNFVHLDMDQFEIAVDDTHVPYNITYKSNNELILQIKTEMIKEKSNCKIYFFYKGKALWLKQAKYFNTIYGLDKSLYQIKIDQQIIVKQLSLNYNYTNKNLEILLKKENEHLKIVNNFDIDSIILVNSNKFRVIDVNNKKINYKYIQEEIGKEKYYLFAVKDMCMYPLKIKQPVLFQRTFMNYQFKGNTLHISYNYFKVKNLQVTQLNNESTINLKFTSKNELNENDSVEVGVMNTDYSDLTIISSTNKNGRIIAKVPHLILENIKKKKIFISINNKYYLLSSNKVIFKSFYKFNSEIYQVQLLNKNGLTFLYKRPKFKAGVNNIERNKINVYFQPHSIYQHYEYYLSFEERDSDKKNFLPIEKGEQDVYLDYNNMLSILSKRKSIIDIFISIYDEDELVRKEKIKFKQGVYKKDTIQSLAKVEKAHSIVYFMLTLTPFKNIKYETFELSTKEQNLLNDNKQKNNDIWLIGERTDTAQDNGIQLFKWLRANTNLNVYYVIDEESEDYKTIKNLDNILLFGSEDHFKIASKAKVLMSTHDIENILPYKAAPSFGEYENTIKIFLQHGVLGRKNVEYHRKYYESPFDLFIVSSDDEKQDVVMKEMGYYDNEVAVTGLSRFDNLPLKPNKLIKKILIMPTWRDWLNSNEAFIKSDYLKRYIDLINSEKLRELSKIYKLEINFYPHYRAQSYFKLYLENSELSIVNYIELGEKTVQDLLIEHDLLITDYSSVSFDFNYMNKPVLFYHFDVNKFFRKGILRPIQETFIGEIAYSENELLSKIKEVITKPQQNYKNKKLIFNHIDHKNAQRTYESIVKKIEELNE